MAIKLIGKRLKQLRKHLGLSQKEFADRLHTSSGYISEIEQSKKIPGGELLFLLRQNFDANINWILAGHGDMLFLGPENQDRTGPEETEPLSGMIEGSNSTTSSRINLEDLQVLIHLTEIADHNELIQIHKLANSYLDKALAAHYPERFRNGMRYISSHRQDVVRFLHGYYQASSSLHTEAQTIRYSGLNNEPHDLPLITRENLIYQNNNNLEVKSAYSDETIVTPQLSPDEIIREIVNWTASKLQIWDDPLYTINKLEDTLKITFRLTRFLNYRVSYGSVADELAVAIATHGIAELSRSFGSLLPKRNRFLGSLDAFLNFSTRLCVGGVTVLFAARTEDNDIDIILQRRSLHVSDEPGSFTVIPRAFHQPVINPLKEVDVPTTIYRECYEELFGGEAEPDQRRHISSHYFLTQCPGVAELYVGQNGKNHYLQPLGIVWDLVKGTYAIAYCLYVHDPEWWQKYQHGIRVNWEVDTKVEPVVRLSQTNLIHNLIQRREWAPEAYFTFIEGLRWLAQNEKKLANIKSILPQLDITPLKPML